MKSSNSGGASDTYTYDQLNRLSTVTDASGATTYAYDAVGNLQNFTYPSGVTHAYSYDTLNRLTQVGAAKNSNSISNYAYTLGLAGNRLTVAELSGRTVNYGYDSLYRLTSEAVSNDPNNHDGTTSYQYDSVGNRKQLLVNGTTANTYTYDPDDRLGSDQYDADGNTTNSGGTANTYDFENHMTQHGLVTLVYDGDGNRVSETVGGVTTNYLVDTQNPTGYAQVVDELQNGTVARTYSFGLDRISETQTLNSVLTTSFYGYDGHGSVRQLTSASGAITDTFDYDAFGNIVDQTGSTPNNYLFAGEQYDPALGLYYNRARYLNTTTGRFWSMDAYEGYDQSPLSLHKYLYVANNVPNSKDSSGRDFDLGSVSAALSAGISIATESIIQAVTVIGNIYYTLGPAFPLIVEKGFFYLAAGAVFTQVIAGLPSGLRAIDDLANNISAYSGQFSSGWGQRGIQVGRAAGQNLGDGFPVFDNFDFGTGEGTQIYSTTQIQTTQQLVAAIRAKASQFQAGFDSADVFSGKDSDGYPVQFMKSQVTTRNMLVVTPPIRNFPLSRIATELEQAEAAFGLDEIVVEESTSLAP
jgi:RHS repeat-associated protein